MTFVNTVIQAEAAHTASQHPIEQEMARLIVETLQLEIAPHAIAPGEPLFIEGLGLDSIDALELALAIAKRYGVELKSDDARKGEIFACLRSLSAHVEACRTR
jgi:acyl carrier protein